MTHVNAVRNRIRPSKIIFIGGENIMVIQEQLEVCVLPCGRDLAEVEVLDQVAPLFVGQGRPVLRGVAELMDGAGALGEDGADGLVIQLAAPGTFGVLDPCENSVFAYMKVEMRRVSYNNVYRVPVQYLVQAVDNSEAADTGLVSKTVEPGISFMP